MDNEQQAGALSVEPKVEPVAAPVTPVASAPAVSTAPASTPAAEPAAPSQEGTSASPVASQALVAPGHWWLWLFAALALLVILGALLLL